MVLHLRLVVFLGKICGEGYDENIGLTNLGVFSCSLTVIMLTKLPSTWNKHFQTETSQRILFAVCSSVLCSGIPMIQPYTNITRLTIDSQRKKVTGDLLVSLSSGDYGVY